MDKGEIQFISGNKSKVAMNELVTDDDKLRTLIAMDRLKARDSVKPSEREAYDELTLKILEGDGDSLLPEAVKIRNEDFLKIAKDKLRENR